MKFYKYFACLAILLFSLNSFAKSCEKNNSCRERFKGQKDPYDIQRESSRAHIAAFFMANFAVNRFLESDFATEKLGRKLSKNERILYTALGLTAVGLVKELVYDPDGLSRADMASNTTGLVLSMAFEWTLF